jgi:hypothetical protein
MKLITLTVSWSASPQIWLFVLSQRTNAVALPRSVGAAASVVEGSVSGLSALLRGPG